LLPRLGEVIALERKELDLVDPENIRRVMRDTKPQLVVNAAAYTAVDAAETDEASAHMVNAEAPRLLALEAKKLSATLVHFSTDYVFDGSKKTPYIETDSPESTERLWQNETRKRTSDSRLGRWAPDISHILGLRHVWPKFRSDDIAPCRRARRIENRSLIR
jgi:nucleoside-diphosphate-sugar epimerase